MGDFRETIPQVHTDSVCTATMKVTLASLLLVAGASAMPKADPQLIGAPLVPSIYHTQNCTNQEDTITVQQCGLEPVETEAAAEAEPAVEAERKRREAEADPQVLLHTPYLAAPVVPLLKHACKDVEQEYCYPET